VARAPATQLIRFRTLGSTDLRNPAGEEIRGVLAQPKRLALLAYLAFEKPGGFHRRDTLLALFWPDLDLAHARDALNQAIRHLRIELGAEAIVSRGTTEVGLDVGRLWCDAVAFREAIAAGDPEHALELYAGTVLEGFFTSDVAPEFEQWLDVQRSDVRQKAAAAAVTLAERAAAAEEIAKASEFARRAASLQPDSEDVWRRAIAVLDSVGERAAALALFERFSQRMVEEYGAEPTPEMRRFVAGIRARRDPRPALPNESAETVDAAAAARDANAARRSIGALTVMSRRRGVAMSPLRLGALVAALPLSLLLVQRLIDRPSGAALPPDANLLAVAPFDVVSREHDPWREGLMDLLAAQLEGAGPLHSVSPSLVIQSWRGRADEASTAALGRRTGAGIVLYGNVVSAGHDSVRVSTRLRDLGSGSASEIEVRDLAARLDRVADSISVRVLRELGRTRPIAAVPSAGFASQSLPAIKAYLAGEKFYRRVRRDSAMAYYARAVSLDTTFALAWRRMAQVRWMGVSEGDDTVSMYGLRAGRLNHGLSTRDSLLVLADSLYAAGQPRWGRDKVQRLHATLDEATREFPRDAEAWRQTALARTYAPMVGTAPERTLESIDRAIQLDSSFAPSFDWLSAEKLALQLNDVAAARRHIVLGTVWESPQRQEGLKIALGILDGRRAAQRSLDQWLDTASVEAMDVAAHALEDWPDSAETAVRLRRTLLARARDSSDTDSVNDLHIHLSYALARRGHLRESFTSSKGHPFHFFAQTAHFGGIPESAIIERALQQPYGLLSWLAERRDTVALRRALRQLDSIARGAAAQVASTPEWDVARARAYLSLARGDTTDAIRRFVPVIESQCPGCSFSRTYVDIFTAAPLIASRGMYQRAATWLDFDNTTVLRPVFDVWFALARGRIAERLGKREKAAAEYRFVAASWRDADPQLQPYVNEARAALQRLASARRRRS
jgi:serine/threonine-protein kinase